MSEPTDDFEALMQRVRTGCPEAARQLFERFGEHVRRVVRLRLDPRLRRQYDSMDFAQSVWASFFDTPPGRYTFTSPEALIAFLTRTASNKVIEVARKRLGTAKYDLKREQSLDRNLGDDTPLADVVPGPSPTPSQVAIADERWEILLQGQPTHHRRILELLREGHTHDEIAAAVHVHPKTIQRLVQLLRRKLTTQ